MSHLCLVITLSLTKKFRWLDPSDFWFLGLIGLCWFVSLRSFETGVDRWLLIIPAALILTLVGQWPYSANHHWFFLWVAIPVLLQPKYLTSVDFSQYVSLSMGIMMLAAAVQKLIGGHYLDGSFFAYFATAGGATENLLNLFCEGTLTQDQLTPCLALVWMSRLSLLLQVIIGLFFLFNLRSRLIYTLEIMFLLGVGTIADEWVFQAITLLCLLFVIRGRVPIWILFGIIPFTLVGIYKLDTIIYQVMA